MKNPLLRLTLLLSCILLLGGCASSVRVKNITSLNPIVPKSDESKPILFKKIVIKIPRAKVVGSIQHGLMCIPSEQFYWRGGKRFVSDEEFGDILRNELEKNGYTVVGDPNALFEDETTWKAEYLIAGRISDMSANVCYPYAGYGNFIKSKGEGYMEVEWHVYSRKTRDVVLRFKTEGSSKIEKSMATGDEEIFYQAFAMAVNNMLADREFYELVALDKEFPKRKEVEKYAELGVKYKRLNDIGMKREFKKEDMVSNIRKSTVTIFAGDGHGSGFIMSDDGYVLTNSHVVGGAKFVQVKLVTGSEKTGEVIRVNKTRDVALIKLEEDLYPFSVLANSANIDVSDPVFAIGAPLKEELSHSVTKGIISSFRVEDGIRFIQSDVNVQPGNSGGPLVSEKYGVVGIAVQGEILIGLAEGGLVKRSVGLNYFIPIEEALKTLNIVKKD